MNSRGPSLSETVDHPSLCWRGAGLPWAQHPLCDLQFVRPGLHEEHTVLLWFNQPSAGEVDAVWWHWKHYFRRQKSTKPLTSASCRWFHVSHWTLRWREVVCVFVTEVCPFCLFKTVSVWSQMLLLHSSRFGWEDASAHRGTAWGTVDCHWLMYPPIMSLLSLTHTLWSHLSLTCYLFLDISEDISYCTVFPPVEWFSLRIKQKVNEEWHTTAGL